MRVWNMCRKLQASVPVALPLYVFLQFSVFSCVCRVLTVRCSQSSDPVLQAPAARVLSPAELSDYISFGRQKYTPELTDAAADKLVQGACTSHQCC